ncbi:ATP-binding protein [Candidatus Chloroploca mongolica]|uniref:ATP-binding protein n=1 Tax=Candidatus Chloroploca mongolica TaxID=2528176 RepID=UPI0020B4451E|nr:ATP-binding protein [Candidatus Chloroploca mongolica]
MLSVQPEQATEALMLLAEATRLLYEDQPLQQRVHRVFELLRGPVSFRDARLTCWLQSAQPGTARQQYYSARGWPYPWDEALTRRVALNGVFESRTIVLSNEAAGDGDLPVMQATYLGTPIFWGGRLWGVIELRAPTGTNLVNLGREMLTGLLPQLAIAIAREGRREPVPVGLAPVSETPTGLTLEPQRHQQLSELDTNLEQMLDLHELLSLLLRRTIEATGADAGAIVLVDHQRRQLILQLAEGYPSSLQQGLTSQGRQRFNWETGLAGQAAHSGRVLLVRDHTTQAGLQPTWAGARTELAAPVLLGDRPAAIILLHSTRANAFGEDELSFMRALCRRVANPLNRAIHYQEALESANYLGQVFASLPTGLALIDASGKVLRANPAWSEIWGLRGVLARSPFHVSFDLVELLLPRLQDPMRLTEFFTRCQRNPAELQTTRVRMVNPNQNLQILSVPTSDSQHRITGRLWAVTDVTREGEADRLKHEFVSMVSHELRTPLTSILGYTELLLNREFTAPDRMQFMQTVFDEASRLSQLVEDLLSISRIEAGKVQLNRWLTSLHSIVAELTTQLNTQLARHRMLLDVAHNLPPVYIDRDKVKQIIFNLLTNAIKYSPNGGQIVLAIKETDEADLPLDHPPGRWIRIAISDKGLGIAPEDLPRIWERFYRVDNTNTRRIGGTGLGLSITRALVELHGGRIWAESELGTGSTFTFTLPIPGVNVGFRQRLADSV